jgi:hypothetical protein
MSHLKVVNSMYVSGMVNFGRPTCSPRLPLATLKSSSSTGRASNFVRSATSWIMSLIILITAACSVSQPQIDLPTWMESTARWRDATPRINTTKLDLTAARYAKSYRELHGSGRYREFAVQQPKTQTDVTSAIESALIKAGRQSTKREIFSGLDDESAFKWTMGDAQTIVMIYLTNIDPVRKDLPAFVLLFEPK